MSLVQGMNAALWSVCSSTNSSVLSEGSRDRAGEGGSTGWSWNQRAGPTQPNWRPTTSAASLWPSCDPLLQQPASGGNVSLLSSQETSMPKQGASCPDTALPVGYVRTFLPSLPPCSLSLSIPLCVCLSPTLLADCPWASCLSVILFSYFFSG